MKGWVFKSKRLAEIRERKENDLKVAEAELEKVEMELLALSDKGTPEEIKGALRRLDMAREARRRAKAALLEPPNLRLIMIDNQGQAWVRRKLLQKENAG